jgi:hypothetical protein
MTESCQSFPKGRELRYLQNLGADHKKAFEQHHALMCQPAVPPAERRTTSSTSAVALLQSEPKRGRNSAHRE